MTIKVMSYEECREEFFKKIIKGAENKIKYWKGCNGYLAEETLANAGAEIQYCKDALDAMEKRKKKKPIAEIAKDYEGNIFDVVYRCPVCGRTICFEAENDIKKLYPYCNCGQALDWGDVE